MDPRPHYERLANLFDYPGTDYPARVQVAAAAVAAVCPPAARALEAFRQALPASGESFAPEALDEIQEIFTRTFDVQAVTTLSVGYLMFGDDYKRGELLVHLNREQREAGIDCGSELADHLPNVLRLLARWGDGELAQEFADEILHPALERMIAEFGEQRMAERNRLFAKHYKTLIASSAGRNTIFRQPLSAVSEVLAGDFVLAEKRAPAQESDFLRSLDRELDIESGEDRLVQLGRSQ